MKRKIMWEYIIRASKKEKEEMQMIIDSYNELSEHDNEAEPWQKHWYSLEKASCGYLIKWHLKEEDDPDEHSESGSFIRCIKCGAVNDFWGDDTIALCWQCDLDFNS